MSMRNGSGLASLTLKETDWPGCSEARVAKPWMSCVPAPLTSHSVDGEPGSWFSRTMRLGELETTSVYMLRTRTMR